MDFHKLYTPCNQCPDQQTGYHQYPLSQSFPEEDGGLWEVARTYLGNGSPWARMGPSLSSPLSQPL